jgi:hypothetical protein
MSARTEPAAQKTVPGIWLRHPGLAPCRPSRGRGPRPRRQGVGRTPARDGSATRYRVTVCVSYRCAWRGPFGARFIGLWRSGDADLQPVSATGGFCPASVGWLPQVLPSARVADGCRGECRQGDCAVFATAGCGAVRRSVSCTAWRETSYGKRVSRPGNWRPRSA